MRGFALGLCGLLMLVGCSDDGHESQGATDTGGRPNGSGGRSSSGGDGDPTTTSDHRYGDVYTGQYHLGPVDFAESDWHNACAPAGGYRDSLQEATGLGGEYLAGVSTEHADGGGVCDACIEITAETGRTIVARVVTYGVTNEPGDLDVSPSVYEELNTGEYPRSMSWQFAACPDVGPLAYEFQTEANVWWTSLWVRNPRVPLDTVDVRSANHANFIELTRGSDGTLTDAGGFGEGEFTLRLTAMDGQVITETFPGFDPGELVVSSQQFE